MDWKQRYTYNFPTRIRFGCNVIDELPSYLKEHHLSKPLFVTDPGFAKLDLLKKIAGSSDVFCEIDKNPVKSNVQAGVDAYKANKNDAIIGIGGGASMDVARAIAMWVNHPNNDLFDFDDSKGGDKYVVNEIPHFITIPTTSGTGSEVGRSTVISDDITHAKKILFSPRSMANIVFADPNLTMTLPAHITAATGLDALTHCIEAYLAKGFSPLCDGIAIEGMRLVFESLETATHKPDIESRSKMMMAALMGATAFQKGLGIVHSMAHPLSTMFDMHHGLANAIMLTYGMEFNQTVCADKFKFIAQLAGTKDIIKYLKEFNLKLNLPIDLRSQNIDLSDVAKLEALSQLAFDDVCHQSNPRAAGLDDFKALYLQATT